MSARAMLTLIKSPRREAEPPRELIEEAVEFFADCDLSSFATDLFTARQYWRAHRELVEAETVSDDLLRACISDNGDPEGWGVHDAVTTKAEAVEIVRTTRMDEVMERARQIVIERMKKRASLVEGSGS